MAGLVEALVGGVQGAASAGSMIAMERLKDNALKLREERNAALKDRYAQLSEGRQTAQRAKETAANREYEKTLYGQRKAVIDEEKAAAVKAKQVQWENNFRKTKEFAEIKAKTSVEVAEKVAKIQYDAQVKIEGLKGKHKGEELKIKQHNAWSLAYSRIYSAFEDALEAGTITTGEVDKIAGKHADMAARLNLWGKTEGGGGALDRAIAKHAGGDEGGAKEPHEPSPETTPLLATPSTDDGPPAGIKAAIALKLEEFKKEKSEPTQKEVAELLKLAREDRGKTGLLKTIEPASEGEAKAHQKIMDFAHILGIGPKNWESFGREAQIAGGWAWDLYRKWISEIVAIGETVKKYGGVAAEKADIR